MALSTPTDIINFSLRAAGILSIGQSANAQDYTDCFDALNAMLGVWARKRWMIFNLIDVHAVSTGAQSYTIGPGGDFNTPRPDRLEAAFFRQVVQSQPNNIDYPLTIINAREDYNDIALKSLVSWPTYVFYDASFPMGRIFPWPIPQAGLYDMHLTLKFPLAQFTSLTQQIQLPPEYTEAIWSNLAIRIGAIYPGVELTQAIEALAKSSMATIRGANAQIGKLDMPSGLVRGALYNIFSDQTY